MGVCDFEGTLNHHNLHNAYEFSFWRAMEMSVPELDVCLARRLEYISTQRTVKGDEWPGWPVILVIVQAYSEARERKLAGRLN